MSWSKPDFVEISLCMEVTAYANTDDTVSLPSDQRLRSEEPRPKDEQTP